MRGGCPLILVMLIKMTLDQFVQFCNTMVGDFDIKGGRCQINSFMDNLPDGKMRFLPGQLTGKFLH